MLVFEHSHTLQHEQVGRNPKISTIEFFMCCKTDGCIFEKKKDKV